MFRLLNSRACGFWVLIWGHWAQTRVQARLVASFLFLCYSLVELTLVTPG